MNNYDKIKHSVSDAQGMEPIPAIKNIREQTGLGLGASKMVYNLTIGGDSMVGKDYSYPYVREALAYILQDHNETSAPLPPTPLPADQELRAIQKILDALQEIPHPARQRVLGYIQNRIGI